MMFPAEQSISTFKKYWNKLFPHEPEEVKLPNSIEVQETSLKMFLVFYEEKFLNSNFEKLEIVSYASWIYEVFSQLQVSNISIPGSGSYAHQKEIHVDSINKVIMYRYHNCMVLYRTLEVTNFNGVILSICPVPM